MIAGHTKPEQQEKYSKQRKEWKELWQIYESSTFSEQTEWPTIEDIVERLHLINSHSPGDAESSSGEPPNVIYTP